MIKLNVNMFSYVKRILFAAFLILFIVGCGPTTPKEEVEVGSEEILEPSENNEDNTTVVDEPEVSVSDEDIVGSSVEPTVGDSNPSETAKDYKAISTVTQEKMTLEETTKLKIWIGEEKEAEKYQPKENNKMAHDTVVFSAVNATYARITPSAPEFEVEPKSIIVPIVATGVEKTFVLTPKQEGTFQVSAEIELFDNKDCIGVGKPVASGEVIVEVSVDNMGHFKKFLRRLGSEFGSQFETFFAALLVILFGALIFVIRKFIKKKTDYNDDNNNKPTTPTGSQDSGSDPII
ncbi:MAG: hypothetical protein IKU03_02490 [Bacteroidales bacterium]|nr:hypothetical protein [Bacteroidales bacterium]